MTELPFQDIYNLYFYPNTECPSPHMPAPVMFTRDFFPVHQILLSYKINIAKHTNHNCIVRLIFPKRKLLSRSEIEQQASQKPCSHLLCTLHPLPPGTPTTHCSAPNVFLLGYIFEEGWESVCSCSARLCGCTNLHFHQCVCESSSCSRASPGLGMDSFFFFFFLFQF